MGNLAMDLALWSDVHATDDGAPRGRESGCLSAHGPVSVGGRSLAEAAPYDAAG